MSLSLIIPTLNAGKTVATLLDAVIGQTVIPDEIIVVDSESDDETLSILSGYPMVSIISVRRDEFDHGGTRDFALRQSRGDIVCFMTQDAIPADDLLFDNLIAMLNSDHNIAVASARQLAFPNASEMEKLVRSFNYPPDSSVRSAQNVDSMGIKAFFCSDVCAAYRRDIYYALGGFEHPLSTNEDMFFAAKAINAGYKTAYCAEALVFHSHDFSLKEQFLRNKLQGYEIERHSALLGSVSQSREGFRLVRHVSTGLLKKALIVDFLRFGLDCCARFSGSRAGRRQLIRKLRH